MKRLDFRARIEVDSATGATLAVYLQVRSGKAHRVVELAGGAAFVNVDRAGRLLGVEILAPCNISVVETAARGEPEEVKRFVLGHIPPSMALVA